MLILKPEVRCGTFIENAIEKAQRLADVTGCVVQITFSEIEIFAHPPRSYSVTTKESLLHQYKLNLKNK